jgi:hypothetical protein
MLEMLREQLSEWIRQRARSLPFAHSPTVLLNDPETLYVYATLFRM